MSAWFIRGSILVVHVDHSRNDAFARGAILFNAGAFFEAHEAWETGWRVETDPTQRRFLQGLIQVAAGFHKLLAIGSVDSGSRLLAKGMAKLEACPPQVGGADAMTFLDGVRACADDLASGRFDRAAIPHVGTTRP
jgi:predicted metal-dependent hydrolase